MYEVVVSKIKFYNLESLGFFLTLKNFTKVVIIATSGGFFLIKPTY